MSGTATLQASEARQAWLRHWPLLLGLVALSVSTIATLGQQVWSREEGAHGPIILATGAWLLWRQASSFVENRRPSSTWLTMAPLTFWQTRAMSLNPDRGLVCV